MSNAMSTRPGEVVGSYCILVNFIHQGFYSIMMLEHTFTRVVEIWGIRIAHRFESLENNKQYELCFELKPAFSIAQMSICL